MPRYDIMPLNHGGATPLVVEGRMNASETFEVGELVFLNDDGEVEEFPQDASEALVADADSGVIFGIATGGPSDVTARNINPDTGVAYATGDRVSFWRAGNPGQLWITDNYFATAHGAAATPPGTIVGEALQVGYSTTAAAWGLSVDAATEGTDIVCRVTAVLDSQKDPISATDTTNGVYVVFEMDGRA